MSGDSGRIFLAALALRALSLGDLQLSHSSYLLKICVIQSNPPLLPLIWVMKAPVFRKRRFCESHVIIWPRKTLFGTWKWAAVFGGRAVNKWTVWLYLTWKWLAVKLKNAKFLEMNWRTGCASLGSVSWPCVLRLAWLCERGTCRGLECYKMCNWDNNSYCAVCTGLFILDPRKYELNKWRYFRQVLCAFKELKNAYHVALSSSFTSIRPFFTREPLATELDISLSGRKNKKYFNNK